jgi:hypothetical protein
VSCNNDKEIVKKIKPDEFFLSVKENSLTHSSISVEWTKSKLKDNTNVLYDVYLNEELIDEDLSANSYDFNFLEPEKNYRVQIVAKSIYDTERKTNISFITKEAPAPAKFKLWLSESKESSISIEWENLSDDLTYDIVIQDKEVEKEYKINNYTFQNLEPNEEYRIKLIARNKYNKTVENSILVKTQKALPDSFQVEIKNISCEFIEIVWDNKPDYKLIYSINVDGELIEENYKGGNYLINNLQEDSLYEIVLTATNQYSQTIKSSISARTKKLDDPIDFNIQVLDISQNTALIRWKSISEYDEYGSDYKIFIDGFYKGLMHNDSEFFADKLEAGKTYQVKVVAKNHNQKEIEKTIEFQTLPAVELSDFTIKLNKVGAKTAQIVWTASQSSGSEEVNYRIYTENNVVVCNNTQDQEYSFNNLRGETKYTYYVEAVTQNEYYYVTKKKFISFETIAYEKPSDFKIEVTDITEDTVIINWTDSKLSDGSEIYYRMNHLGESYAISQNSYTLRNLKANTNYSISVKAISLDGAEREKTIYFKTKPAVELKHTIAQVKYRSILLEWEMLNTTGSQYAVLQLGSKTVYQGRDGAYLLKNLKPNTSYNLKLNVTINGKSYVKKITQNTAAYPAMKEGNFIIKSTQDTYNTMQIDCSDFMNKNADLYQEEYAHMKLAYIVGGRRFESKVKNILPLPADLAPNKLYDIQIIYYYSDWTKAYEKSFKMKTLENKMPVWNNSDLVIKNIGSSFVEFENNFAKDIEPDTAIREYHYYVNNQDISNRFYTDARGEGQIMRGANNNDESILIQYIEADREYEFYIEAIDKFGAKISTKKIKYRTYADPVNNFAIEAEQDEPGLFIFSWKKNRDKKTVDEIKAFLKIDGEPMIDALGNIRGKVLGGPEKMYEENGYFKIKMDLRAFLKKNPNISIDAKLKIEFIENELIQEAVSEEIRIN